MTQAKNAIGGSLEICCGNPVTGFYRDGFCKTGPGDFGRHTICAQVTAEFLEFTKSCGNDLSTPVPAYQFPGLKPGDRWCLCAGRWLEALKAGVAPPVILSATHETALEVVAIEQLQPYAID